MKVRLFGCTGTKRVVLRQRTLQLLLLAPLLGVVTSVVADRSGEMRTAPRSEDLIVSIEDGSAMEGRPVELKVTVSQERPVPLHVHWELSPATAVEGVDYRPGQGGTLRIPAGETEGRIRVRTVADRVAEPDDAFTVSLLDVTPIPPDGAFVSETASVATGTIIDDDGELKIHDTDLRRALERALHKDPNEEITGEDMGSLTGLTVTETWPNLDLTGLEFATNLEILNVVGDRGYGAEIFDRTINLGALGHLPQLIFLYLQHLGLRDLSPLSQLTRLQELYLPHNRIDNLDLLVGLTALRWLVLRDNAVSGLEPLRHLRQLSAAELDYNVIDDVSPLAALPDLRRLIVNNNLISDISPLRHAHGLGHLNLAFNSIADVSPIQDASRLHLLVLNNNRVADLSPLASKRAFSSGNHIHVYENPLNDESREVHVQQLRAWGARVYDTGVWLAGASALEGDPLEFNLLLSAPADEPVDVNYSVSGHGPATAGVDFSADPEGTVTVPAGSTRTAIVVETRHDREAESHEPVRASVYGSSQSFPEGVSLRYDDLDLDAVGLIIEPGLPADHVPFIESADRATRQSVLRVINHFRDTFTAVRIEAVDDRGNRPKPVTLSVRRGWARQLNSGDLVNGNLGKGLADGIGSGHGDWRLRVLSNDVEALAYMRTQDGLLTGMHDVVPLTSEGYVVPIFNPARNPNQMSWLRLSNDGERTATVRISGVDDRGRSPGSEISFRLAAGRTQVLTSARLESGSGLNGALGRGTGKWRLVVASNVRIHVMNLLESPTGHLSNLSTLATPIESDDGTEATWWVPLFPSAMDAKGREGFVRVINRGPRDASVIIKARDESRWDYEPVTLTVAAGDAVQFNSHDLESGNAEKGLPYGVGAGEGNWRLELTSTEALAVGAYIRTGDGFLTSMHDTVPGVDGEYFVPTFNPARNTRQVSSLYLINPGGRSAEVRVRAVDDRDKSPGDEVLLYVGGNSARTVSSPVLEAGLRRLVGRIGKGYGKWRLTVSANRPVYVVNLMETPTGHLVNLSSRPALNGR